MPLTLFLARSSAWGLGSKTNDIKDNAKTLQWKENNYDGLAVKGQDGIDCWAPEATSCAATC